MIGRVRDRLPSTNVPAAVYFVDTLPRTPSVKIQISEVRAQAEHLHRR